MVDLIRREDNLPVRIRDETMQYCSFYIGGNLYGVDILHVREVNIETLFTKIYHSSDKIKGYVNIRGQIYLVLYGRKLLGIEGENIAEESKILLFKEEIGESFGILVDKVGDVIEVNRNDFTPANEVEPSENGENDSEYIIAGTCKLESKLLTVIDAKKILKLI